MKCEPPPNYQKRNKKIMRIMVVDDEPDVLDLITAYLSDSGHEIEATTNSVEAMERLKLGGYDALVTDVLIPDFDGIELIRAVRRSKIGRAHV